MTDETDAPLREDTMLYRTPTDDSDENAVQDIWGQRLEIRTVDVSEVADLLNEGWVQHPLDLGKKPEERAGFAKVAGKELEHTRAALDTAEKLVAELTKERDAVVAANTSITEQAQTLLDEKAAWMEERYKLQSDLRAAEELFAGSTEGRDAKLQAKADEKAVQAKTTGKG
jgi:hypothetical protein